MSKDVVIAGAIVAACLGLVTVAFVLPKHKTVKTDPVADLTTASNDTAPSPTTPSDPAPLPTDFTQPSQPGLPSQPGNLAINSPPPGGLPQNGPSQPVIFNSPPSAPFKPSGFQNSFPPQQPQVIVPDPAPLPPPAPTAGEAKTHLVASGETLGEISMKYYGTSKNWKKIAEANKIGDPSDMHVGQKLTIPVIESAKPKEGAPTETPALSAGEHVYKVRAGDSYYTIAKKELGNPNRWKELEKLNNIPAEELHVGQSIKLPNKEAAPAAAPGTAAVPGASEPAPTGSGRVHVVASGDTLADISKKYFGTTTKWKDIVKANPGVDPEGLKVGQKLNIPEGAAVTPGAGSPAAPAAAEAGEAGEYEVKAGDTLESIAQSQLGNKKDWKKIVDANPGLDAKHMRLKQKLKIPGKAKPAEPSAPIPPPIPQPTPGFGSPTGFGTPSGGLNGNPGGGFGNPNSGFNNPNGLGPSPAYPTPGSANPAPGNNGFAAPPPSPAYPSPSAPPALPPSTAPVGAPPARGANGIPP